MMEPAEAKLNLRVRYYREILIPTARGLEGCAWKIAIFFVLLKLFDFI